MELGFHYQNNASILPWSASLSIWCCLTPPAILPHPYDFYPTLHFVSKATSVAKTTPFEINSNGVSSCKNHPQPPSKSAIFAVFRAKPSKNSLFPNVRECTKFHRPEGQLQNFVHFSCTGRFFGVHCVWDFCPKISCTTKSPLVQIIQNLFLRKQSQ